MAHKNTQKSIAQLAKSDWSLMAEVCLRQRSLGRDEHEPTTLCGSKFEIGQGTFLTSEFFRRWVSNRLLVEYLRKGVNFSMRRFMHCSLNIIMCTPCNGEIVAQVYWSTIVAPYTGRRYSFLLCCRFSRLERYKTNHDFLFGLVFHFLFFPSPRQIVGVERFSILVLISGRCIVLPLHAHFFPCVVFFVKTFAFCKHQFACIYAGNVTRHGENQSTIGSHGIRACVAVGMAKNINDFSKAGTE